MGGNERLPERLSSEPAERGVNTSGRKRAGAALRASEERLHTLVTNAPVILFGVNRDGVYTFMEGKGLEALGRKPGDVVGRSVFDVYRDRPDIIENVRRALAGMTFRKTVEWQGVTFDACYGPVRDDDGQVTGMIGVATDVTERKRAEQALRESEARYHGLVEHIPAIVYVAALDEGSTTLYISSQVELLLGISPVEWTTHPELFVERLHPGDRERVLADLAVTHGNGEPFVSEYRLLAGDGRVRWFHDEAVVIRDAAGEPLVLQGVMLDITERKRAEEELRASEERLHTVVMNAPVILFAIDREGVVTLSEGKGLEPLGLEPGELVGRSVFDMYSDTPQIIENVRRALAGETFTTTVRVLRLAFETQYAPLRSEDGQVAGVIAVATDVTERTRAEEALQKAREELEIRVERRMQAGDPYGLSFRELTVLHLVAVGRADKQIGGELGISALTVNKHVAHILGKMGAASRTEAGVRAVREGLLG